MPRLSHARAAIAVLGVALASTALLTLAAVPATAVSAHDPRGHLDSLSLTGSTVSFRGWAADPDVPGIVRLVVSIDGIPATSALASQARPDVAKAFPAFGANRGFIGSFVAPQGKHTVCIVAGDLSVGSDVKLGCVTMTVPKSVNATPVSLTPTSRPYGALDAVSYANNRLTVTGWTIDPDTAGPLFVDAMVNGQSYGSAVANVARADVAKAHPGYGIAHGYSYTAVGVLAPGNYDVCVVGINSAAGGNTILPCRILTVLPKTEPATLATATATEAAAAIQTQAIASRAAKVTDFPASASAAARLAIATRALLQQASGRTAAPPATAGVPKFVAVTPSRASDVQSVMGLKPALGSYPAAKTGGRSGGAYSLQPFRNDARPASPWGGDGVVGAAPILPANGRTVRPALPAYPAGQSVLRAEVAVGTALANLGSPYVWAASGPSTFDCSGLTQWAWAKAGVTLTHYTVSQAAQGVRVQANQLLPGDLVLFGSDLHHVGMYLGAGYMIDAPYTGAYVRVDKISWFGDFTLAVRP
jgi:cell wall-associated NlpC family hydrolase